MGDPQSNVGHPFSCPLDWSGALDRSAATYSSEIYGYASIE